ncbi:efflux RND transporter permease subunit [Parvularcula sp. IMCC14364]|uniref:efflux RND transporter permease subunit n=1 Tax=Parvularcula sp. IMCC14364 TaxID=3067902 RepID=UPI002740F1D2|nr:efflux RND transporter permease subunit [Parvularcula sp. IMCC14364]
MRSIVSWWASNKVAANLLMVIILITGFVSLLTINREIEPYVEFPGARVSVSWLGASPQDVEEQVIVRLEEAISRVDGIDQLYSFAAEGFGAVFVIGDMDLDESAFLQDIKREVDSINTFPAAVEEPQLSLFDSGDEVMRVAITGDVGERELKRFSEKVRREISLLPYVPAVDVFGIRNEEVSIEVSEETLSQYGLTFSEVANAVRGSSVNQSSGNVRTALGDIQLRTRQLADSRAEFEDIIVRQLPSGAVIRVGDIAEVKDGFEEVDVLATLNGEPTVMIEVLSGPDMDIVKMAEGVRNYVEEAQENLPPGISMILWQDESEMYTSRITTIGSSFFSGLFLVLVTLMLFLRPAIALWVSVGIAIAFAGGLAFLPYLGVSFNMISTFAFLLVIGVIVDDAIIVGEAIHARTEEGEEGLEAAVNGTAMVLKPVIFAVLTTMIFFAPWMLVSGGTAEFTRAISIVVIMALTFSLVECLFILPAHLSHLKPANPEKGILKFQKKIADSVVHVANRYYRPVMSMALQRRYLTVSLFVVAMMLAVGLMSNNIVRFSFMPEPEPDMVRVNVVLPEGTPFSRTLSVKAQIEAAQQQLEEEINEREGQLIENWFARARNNDVFALVRLVPPEERTLTAGETADRLRELIGPVPDAETISVEDRGGRNDPPIQYVLNSTNLEDLTVATNDLMDKLRTYEGVYNVINDTQSASEEVRFTLKPGAEALGITTSTVAQQVRQGFYGEEVQRLPRDGEDVRVFVRYPRADRESLDYLNNMRIRTSDGRELPLYAVADLEYAQGVNRILRRERQRAVVVSAEVVSDRIGEIRSDLQEDYFDAFDQRHPNISRGNIGRAQEEAEFFSELTLLFLLAVGIGYFLVAVAFKSYFEPILILFAAIPFCFTGAVVGHLIMGESMSLFSFLGFIAAAGVAVNDNLVLVDYVHRLRAQGMGGGRALLEAGTRRFRPILLTSLTTFVGLLPLMMEKSIQAAFLIPVGIGLAYGVLFALLVTLFFVPALYGIGADIRRFFIYIFTGKKQPRFAANLDDTSGYEHAPPLQPAPAE